MAKDDDDQAKAGWDDYEVHFAQGRRLEQPMAVSQILAAQLHQGRQDAAQYDEYAIDEELPLRQERVAIDELDRTCEAISNAYAQDILDERGITRKKWMTYHGAISDLDALRERRLVLERDVEAELKEMEQPSSARHVSQVRLRTAPEQKMHRIDWVAYSIAAFSIGAELVMNFLAASVLRETDANTWMIAATVSFVTVMVPWYCGRVIADPTSRFRGLAYGLLGGLVIALLGLGWIRYEYTVTRVRNGLDSIGQTFGGVGPVAIAGFTAVMPLILSGALLLKIAEDRHAVTYHMWLNRRTLAELDQHIADAEESLNGKAGQYRDAIDYGERLRHMAKTAMHAYAATMAQAVESYFDGLAQQMANPAATAVIDRRFHQFQLSFHAEGDQVVQAAIDKLVVEPIWTPEKDEVLRHLLPDIPVSMPTEGQSHLTPDAPRFAPKAQPDANGGDFGGI